MAVAIRILTNQNAGEGKTMEEPMKIEQLPEMNTGPIVALNTLKVGQATFKLEQAKSIGGA